MITAAIGKLAHLTQVCPIYCARQGPHMHICIYAVAHMRTCTHAQVSPVYRGPGGVTPKSFWQPDEFGCEGGVEMALMSCSKSKEEALKYVRRSKAKLLFEVHQSTCSRGAEISWLSQFPAEDEVLFSPLTMLEVQSTRVEGSVLVVSILPGLAR